MWLVWMALGAEPAITDPAPLGACLGEITGRDAPTAGALRFRCNGWTDRVFPAPVGATAPAELTVGVRGILTWSDGEPWAWRQLQIIDGPVWTPVFGAMQAARAAAAGAPKATGGACHGLVSAVPGAGRIEVLCDGKAPLLLETPAGHVLPPGVGVGLLGQITWSDGAGTWSAITPDGAEVALTPAPQLAPPDDF